MIKAQLRNFKKNRIMVCFSLLLSVIFTLTAPFSITSQAYAIGIEGTQSALDTLLALGGLNGTAPSSSSVSDWETFSELGMSQDAYLALYGGFFDSANNYYSGLGDYLISRVRIAASSGSLILEKAMYDLYLRFINDTYNPSVGDTITLGSFESEIPLYNPSSYFTSIYTFINSYGTSIISSNISTPDLDSDYIVLHYHASDTDYFYFVPIVKQTEAYLTLLNDNGSNPSVAGSNSASGYGYINYINYSHRNFESYDINVPFDYYTIAFSHYDSRFAALVQTFRATGSLSVDGSIVSDFVSVGSEVVPDSASIDEDGNVIWSTVAIPVLDSSVNADLIKMLQDNLISIKDYIAALGLGYIDDSMTESEKQAVINSITTGIAQSITETGSVAIVNSSSKVGTLAHVEHAIANAIATVTGQAIPYPDEDPDYVPPGDPHLQDWDFPSLDPDNPDPGGSEEESEEDRNRAADVADGIGVIAGLAGDIFDSASGFNLVTTVGYSFVIFSAILGASHFFGALGGRHDDVKAHPLDWNRSERWTSKNTDFKSDW